MYLQPNSRPSPFSLIEPVENGLYVGCFLPALPVKVFEPTLRALQFRCVLVWKIYTIMLFSFSTKRK